MNPGRIDWLSAPAGPLHGEITVPGDKSISHRALMLAAIAEGASHVRGFLEAADTQATAAIFRQLGVRIEAPRAGERIVHGAGLHGLRAAPRALDCGNSGTAMRLLCGLFAGQAFDSELIGDTSLSKRPMRRVIEPLAKMGARIDAREGDLPPLRIHGARDLRGIDHMPSVASAQVKSAILLAGLYARGETQVREAHPTRDYTERMLATFGCPIEFAPGRTKFTGGPRLRACDVIVPGDFSSAAFFIVAATLISGSHLLLRGVGVDPRRTGLLEILRRMGADIHAHDARAQGGLQVADIEVRHAPLRGIEVPVEIVPDMIDEFPILFVAAAWAAGTTTIHGAAELRLKESDRIAVMTQGLRTLGVRIEETPDGATIEGGTLRGGAVDARGDHRCAMAYAVAGSVARDAVTIRDCANVATSFPVFSETANLCGFDIHVSAG